MYTSTITWTDGLVATLADGNTVRAMGDMRLYPGKRVSTDGNYVYGGYVRRGEQPLIIPDNAGVPFICNDGAFYVRKNGQVKRFNASIDGHYVNNSDMCLTTPSEQHLYDMDIDPYDPDVQPENQDIRTWRMFPSSTLIPDNPYGFYGEAIYTFQKHYDFDIPMYWFYVYHMAEHETSVNIDEVHPDNNSTHNHSCGESWETAPYHYANGIAADAESGTQAVIVQHGDKISETIKMHDICERINRAIVEKIDTYGDHGGGITWPPGREKPDSMINENYLIVKGGKVNNKGGWELYITSVALATGTIWKDCPVTQFTFNRYDITIADQAAYSWRHEDWSHYNSHHSAVHKRWNTYSNNLGKFWVFLQCVFNQTFIVRSDGSCEIVHENNTILEKGGAAPFGIWGNMRLEDVHEGSTIYNQAPPGQFGYWDYSGEWGIFWVPHIATMGAYKQDLTIFPQYFIFSPAKDNNVKVMIQDEIYGICNTGKYAEENQHAIYDGSELVTDQIDFCLTDNMACCLLDDDKENGKSYVVGKNGNKVYVVEDGKITYESETGNSNYRLCFMGDVTKFANAVSEEKGMVK